MSNVSLLLVMVITVQSAIIIYLIRQLKHAQPAEKAKRSSEASSAPEASVDPLVRQEVPLIGQVILLAQKTKALGSPVTVLQILDADGQIHYAAMNGHESGLEVGQKLEFWLSEHSITNETVNQRVVQDDGTVIVTDSRRLYYALTKYRVLRRQKYSEF